MFSHPLGPDPTSCQPPVTARGEDREDRTGRLPRLLCPPQEAVPPVWSESSPSAAGTPAPCLRHKVGLKKCLGDEPKEA